MAPADAEPGWGELPRAEFERLGLHVPHVVPAPGGYLVLRCQGLVNDEETEGDGCTVYWTEEHISFDGGYELSKKTIIARNVPVMIYHFWV